MQYIHDLIFTRTINIHHAYSIVALIISLFGLGIAFFIRRAAVFRLKLACVYILLFVAGLGGFLFEHEKFGMVEQTLYTSFFILMTVLYWREVSSYMTTEGYHRKSLGIYIDDVPDLIWVKDLEHRYTYVNKAVSSLLGLPINLILGKTENDIREVFERTGMTYTIGSEAIKVDNNHTGDFMIEPRIFLDSGIINRRFIALQVYKGPLYNSDDVITRKHVGYFGIGRDLTYDVEDHNRITEHIEKNEMDEAMIMFQIHKNRYQKVNISSISLRRKEEDQDDKSNM